MYTSDLARHLASSDFEPPSSTWMHNSIRFYTFLSNILFNTPVYPVNAHLTRPPTSHHFQRDYCPHSGWNLSDTAAVMTKPSHLISPHSHWNLKQLPGKTKRFPQSDFNPSPSPLPAEVFKLITFMQIWVNPEIDTLYLGVMMGRISDCMGKIHIDTRRVFVYTKLGLLEIMIHSIKLSV